MTGDRREIDEIKARNHVADVIGRYANGLRKSGRHLIGQCPFHDDRQPSFVVYLDTESWHCFGCERDGDAIDFVGRMECGDAWNPRDGAMFRQALSVLETGLPPLRHAIPAEWKARAACRPVEVEPHVQLVLDLTARIYHTTLLTMGRGDGTPYDYLRQRGLTDETIRREGIGYAAGDRLALAMIAYGLSRDVAAGANLLDADKKYREFMTGRIVFVERDRAGLVIHMVGRAFDSRIHSNAPKYLSLKEINRSLHGWRRLDRRPGDKPVIVVESPPDRLTAMQWGYDAIATLGTGMKEDDAVKLRLLKRPKIYVPHNDGGIGLNAARLWQEKIGEGEIALLPDGAKDLNELGLSADGQTVFDEVMRAATAAHQSRRTEAADLLPGQ